MIGVAFLPVHTHAQPCNLFFPQSQIKKMCSDVSDSFEQPIQRQKIRGPQVFASGPSVLRSFMLIVALLMHRRIPSIGFLSCMPSSPHEESYAVAFKGARKQQNQSNIWFRSRWRYIRNWYVNFARNAEALLIGLFIQDDNNDLIHRWLMPCYATRGLRPLTKQPKVTDAMRPSIRLVEILLLFGL